MVFHRCFADEQDRRYAAVAFALGQPPVKHLGLACAERLGCRVFSAAELLAHVLHEFLGPARFQDVFSLVDASNGHR